MDDRTYFVYIMGNRAGTLYTGVTNDLERGVREHKDKLVPGFTAEYNCTWLLHFESGESAEGAIAREKQIKGWLRAKKVALINQSNPAWQDLAVELHEE